VAKEDFLFLTNPMPGQVLRTFADPKAVAEHKEGDYDNPEPENEVAILEDADIITSKVEGENDWHKPILDIDFGAQLIPSSTPGHFHLYLDKAMSWYQYKKLLSALRQAGIIEPGYQQASVNRGYSAVRLPWIDKPKTPPAPAKPVVKEEASASSSEPVPFDGYVKPAKTKVNWTDLFKVKKPPVEEEYVDFGDLLDDPF
jgi:hypothetical protein